MRKFYRLISTTVLGLALCNIACAADIQHTVQFAHGQQSKVIRNAVVRGDRDVYILRANAKQRMSIHITSEENNAVFSIQSPAGAELKHAADGDDATNWSGELSASGNYKIIVGGTRGNASYKLTIKIE